MYEMYEKIRRLCFDNNVTMTKMCADTGIARTTISTLRQGRAIGMKPSTIQKIADYFGVEPSELTETYSITIPASDTDEADSNALTADEMIDYMQELKDRPEMKLLFKAAKTATREEIEAVVNLLNAKQKGE